MEGQNVFLDNSNWIALKLIYNLQYTLKNLWAPYTNNQGDISGKYQYVWYNFFFFCWRCQFAICLKKKIIIIINIFIRMCFSFLICFNDNRIYICFSYLKTSSLHINKKNPRFPVRTFKPHYIYKHISFPNENRWLITFQKFSSLFRK